jgi:hypothetical protein
VSYLLPLWESLQALFLRLERFHPVVSREERLSRFVFTEKHIRDSKVEFAAFMPSKKFRTTSVYRTSSCSEKRIWLLGRLFVERLRGDRKKVCGRADVAAEFVLSEQLSLKPLRKPHPRHCDIEGWPTDKELQRIRAIAIVKNALTRRCR